MLCPKCSSLVQLFFTEGQEYYRCLNCCGVVTEAFNQSIFIEKNNIDKELPKEVVSALYRLIHINNLGDCKHRCIRCNAPMLNIDNKFTCSACGFEWEVMHVGLL